ncbi:armadillo repeat-containing protein 6 homolog [Adelges cooleyi]|uniref:armadillo repeat-containing protein 6 homolog n=1 Tax=Adelges cooleyi TaxID=133065 RepID=UPI0021807F21|nr:armadillo repeat-containing protein 6 homolog [Adelges cooleyi]
MDQKAFDDAINETMELFDMNYSDALTDTINQFQKMGMDMSKVKIKLELADGPLPSALYQLKKSSDVTMWDELELNKIVKNLKTVEIECKTKEGRHLSKLSGAYNIICNFLERLADLNDDHKTQFIKTFDALLGGGQVVYGAALDVMVEMLKNTKHEGVLLALLSWFKTISETEDEREELRVIGLGEIIKSILLSNTTNKEIVIGTCQLIRAQVREDNCSGDFSNAGERSRLMACDVLEPLILILKNDIIVKSDEVTSEIFFTLAVIIVRFEFCRKFNESKGLSIIKLAMEQHTSMKLNTHSFKLLKSLAGDDIVKDDIRKIGLCPLVLSALQRHINNKLLCIEAMKLIAALTLRSPLNSAELVGLGVAELIVQAMKVHSNDSKHQQHACTAIRNIVSRNRELASEFLALSVESIIEKIIAQYNSCEFEAKSALRDLGLEVSFKEQWTGKGQHLNQ